MASWEGEDEGLAPTLAMLREVREPQGGGMGWDAATRLKLTSTWQQQCGHRAHGAERALAGVTCQHLYTSAVQPWRHEDQLQLEIPIR